MKGNFSGRNTVSDRSVVSRGTVSDRSGVSGRSGASDRNGVSGTAGKGRALAEKPVINEPLNQAQEPLSGERKSPFGSGVKGRTGTRPAPGTRIPGTRAPGDKALREGIRLFNMQRWDEALQEFLFVDSAGFRTEERLELSYFLGLCFTKLGRHSDSLPYLEKVVAGGGDMLRVYQCRMTLAYVHVTTGRPKMAESELKRLLDAGFESAMLFNTLAYAAYARKHYRHAIEYYEKALKLEDGNATALNSMGYILVDTGIDPLKGLKFCRKAVEMQPENAAYLDSLGWACFKCRDPSSARNWLRKALDIAPHESTIREHLRIVTGGIA